MSLKDYCFDGKRTLKLKEMPTDAGEYKVQKSELTALTEENMPRLRELIDECLSDPRFVNGREEVKAETWMYPGEGAVRTADYLCEKYKELVPEEDEVK